MRTIKTFIREHPAVSYYLLTFTISWGSLLAIVGPSRIVGTKDEFDRLFPIALPMLTLGPSISGILLTGVVGGRPGLRDYRARLLKWRVSARWYAAAALTAPVYFAATLLALSAFSREFLPGILTVENKASFLLSGTIVALVAGIVEELGWTGFAVFTSRRRYGALATGLIVGVMWGVWHVLPKIWGAAANGVADYMAVDLSFAVIGLTGFRILMVWVYDQTGSLLIAILMHMGLTASTLILQPLVAGALLVTAGLVLTAAPWIIVAVVALMRHRRTPRNLGGAAMSEGGRVVSAVSRPAH